MFWIQSKFCLDFHTIIILYYNTKQLTYVSYLSCGLLIKHALYVVPNTKHT